MNTIQQSAENGKEKRAIGSGGLLNREHVEQTLKFLFSPGETFEVCLIGPKVPKSPLWGNEWAGGKKAVIAGWFNDPAKAADVVVQADAAVSPAGIYCTLNPVNPALLGRAENRLKANAPRTADKKMADSGNLLVRSPGRVGLQASPARKRKKRLPLPCSGGSWLNCAVLAGMSRCLLTAATAGI